MKELNNRTFYNADQAYKMSKQIEEEDQIKELNSLFDQIDPYVRVGRYECNVHQLSEFQKEWLISHNYLVEKIKKPKHWTHNMIKISWNKKDT